MSVVLVCHKYGRKNRFSKFFGMNICVIGVSVAVSYSFSVGERGCCLFKRDYNNRRDAETQGESPLRLRVSAVKY